MGVPVCPDCGTTIEPSWDWCQSCGFDPEGARPRAWKPASASSDASSTGAARVDAARAPDRAPHPLDLLRPPIGAEPEPAAPLAFTGPLGSPDDVGEHRPLTLDDLRRSSPAVSSTTPPASAASPDASRLGAEVEADPSSSVRPSGLGVDGPVPKRTAVDERPPLFPAPSSPAPASAVSAMAQGNPADPDLAPDRSDALLEDPNAASVAVADAGARSVDNHPYFDLPYDAPSPAPGSVPEPEPTARRRRRKVDDRPNAASMAMAAGRIPTDAPPAAAEPASSASTVDLPPPPVVASEPSGTSSVGDPAPAPSPADSSSLGPIVFGQPAGPTPGTSKRTKGTSSLSWVAILMTIVIAVIVLWPTYKNVLDSDPGPVLAPPSAGEIGYAPAGPDGSRAAVDPEKTASWVTQEPPGGGFEVDMPGVVVVRSPTVPLRDGSAAGVVASSTIGRGGYVVAAVDPPAGRSWSTVQQAADEILGGFNGVTGNDLTTGPSTTVGGLPAMSVTGTVDGVPSKGAIALVGDRAFLIVAGNASTSDLDRFLSSFRTTS